MEEGCCYRSMVKTLFREGAVGKHQKDRLTDSLSWAFHGSDYPPGTSTALVAFQKGENEKFARRGEANSAGREVNTQIQSNIPHQRWRPMV